MLLVEKFTLLSVKIFSMAQEGFIQKLGQIFKIFELF